MRSQRSRESQGKRVGKKEARREPEERGEGAGSSWRLTLLPIVVTVCVIVPLRSAVADWNDVPTSSMRPTIVEGDRIYIDKLAYGLRFPFTFTWLARWAAPQRGDIVTIASPEDGIRLVKRIVGLPGDRVAMKNKRLIINGVRVDYDPVGEPFQVRLPHGYETFAVTATEHLPGRDHMVTLTAGVHGVGDFEEVVVPQGHYFFLGDNRDVSKDARIIGPVALDQIYGRASHVVVSVDPENCYRPRFERWFTRL